MEHLHTHSNHDVLIYNIKYAGDGKYLIRLALKKEHLNIGGSLLSHIILRTTNSSLSVKCEQIINQTKNRKDYNVYIAEFSCPAYLNEGDKYVPVMDMNASHLKSILIER